MRHRRLLIALAAAVPITTGCYSFTEARRPLVGNSVRVTFLQPVPHSGGSPEPIRVEGIVLGWDPVLAVEQDKSMQVGTYRSVEALDTIWVPHSDIRVLEVRSFSWTKLALGSLGMAPLLWLAYQSLQGNLEVHY